MKSVIQMVLDSDWREMTKFVEQRAATKIKEKIDHKKQIIIDGMNEGILDSDIINDELDA